MLDRIYFVKYSNPAIDEAIREIQEKGEETKILILIDGSVTISLLQEAEESPS